MSRKKRRLNRSVIAILVLSLLVITGFLLLFVNFHFVGQKSIHEDAKTYKTRHCLAFYPDSEIGKQKAKELCKGVRDDRIFDYTLIPYGDYYLVNYGGENRYFTDSSYQPLVINEVNDEGKKMINDYVRYTFKKDHPDKYYNAEFIKTLQVENIDFSSVSYDISGDDLVVTLPQYEIAVNIPLKYAQSVIGMNFGYPDELYHKPVYLDPDEAHPIICLTFDDGPKFWFDAGTTSTERIVDTLETYDASGTFYVVGDNLEFREGWTDFQAYSFFKDSIGNGNEYGSHTQTHGQALTGYSTAKAIADEINGPIDYMRDFMNYEMKTYRPVEGVFNDAVLAAQPVGAILWDVDSEDWLSRDAETICDRVLNAEYESGDVIIFHDIYDETAESLERIIPALIDKGCQLVTVSDMLKFFNIDVNNLKYFYGPNYYE